MAVRVQPGHPPRADALHTLIGTHQAGILLPLAHGAIADGSYVISPAPPGPPLSTGLRPWGERALLEHFLRPATQVLAFLATCHMTHRAIRLDNLFHGGPYAGGITSPVVLGAAWAAPPASLQSAIYEPPYSGQSIPTGRGNGSIADDVYALGVVLLALAMGRLPMAGLDHATVIRQKLDMGSFQALTGTARLPGHIADLARSMLAEDPEHRPTPALLTDPALARARRVAARPPRRAARALEIGPHTAANARSLASLLAQAPQPGIIALRDGQLELWLRRNLGDAGLASQIENATRQRAMLADPDPLADGLLLAQAVAILDPMAPLCWHGLMVWPDGIGTALASMATNPQATTQLTELIGTEIVATWATLRPERADEMFLRRDARRLSSILQGMGQKANPHQAEDGLTRLRYLLNPLLPCASPLLRGRWVAELKHLLPALETTAPHSDMAHTAPYDPDIAAFIHARSQRRDEREETARFPYDAPAGLARIPLSLYAGLQTRLHPGLALPNLTNWLLTHADPLIDNWEHRPQRQKLRIHLSTIIQDGQVLALLSALDDPDTRMADQNGARQAAETLIDINIALHDITHGGAARAEHAYRMGQELATGVGLASLAGVLMALAVG